MSINKDTGITLGLVITLITTIIGGSFWIKDGITKNTIQLLLIGQRLQGIEQSVDTRFDSLRDYIDGHIEEAALSKSDRFTATDHRHFIQMLGAKNPTLNIDDID